MSIENLTIIGERANRQGSSKVKIILDEEVSRGKYYNLQELAVRQAEQGADYIDINVDDLGEQVMRNAIMAVQEVVDIPLCIDSGDPMVLVAGLGVYDTEKAGGELPIINSADRTTADSILGLRNLKPFKIVLLTRGYLDVKELYWGARKAGFKQEDIYLDPRIVPISSDYEGNIKKALGYLDKISTDAEMRGVHTLLGLTNVSKGSPIKLKDSLENAVLTLALEKGLDTIIGDPSRKYSLLPEENNVLNLVKEFINTDIYSYEGMRLLSKYFSSLREDEKPRK
ncbi:MAG: hypothetical protein ABIH72_00725 [archaeon]